MAQGLAGVLERNLCVSLTMDSGIIGDPEFDDAITALMDQTYTTNLADGHRIGADRQASFHSRLRGDGDPYVAIGQLMRYTSRGFVEAALSFSVEAALGPSPSRLRGVRPVFDLLRAAPELFGRQSFSCTVEFTYWDELSTRSAIPFPASVVLPRAVGNITHIESATFSHRDEQGDLVHSIFVWPPEDSTPLTHVVDFQEVCTLSRRSVTNVLRRAKWLSLQLLENIEGAGNGDL